MVDTSIPGSFAATYDLTLSDEDLDGELTGMTMSFDVAAEVVIQGDVNIDGKVDGFDANILSANFLNPGAYGDGDVNLDGTVDGLDANILSMNFGLMNSDFPMPPPPGGGNPVPEPSTFVLAYLGLALFVGSSRRRRRIG